MDVKKIEINGIPFEINDNPKDKGIVVVTKDVTGIGGGKNSIMGFLTDRSPDLPHFQIGFVSVTFNFSQRSEQFIRMLESVKDEKNNPRFEIK